MRSTVTVQFGQREFRLDLEPVAPIGREDARRWLDDEYSRLGCEPLRPSGKVLNADKVVSVAEAAGLAGFENAGWALDYARAVAAILDKPVVRVDVAALTVGY